MLSRASDVSVKDASSSRSGFQLRPLPMVAQLQGGNGSPARDFFERKQSDPPVLASRAAFFNKLGITCPQPFSSGNASDEPLSAASFSAINKTGLGMSPNPNCESPENQTPTLPSRRDSSQVMGNFDNDLDAEVLGNQERGAFLISQDQTLKSTSPDLAGGNAKFFSPDTLKHATSGSCVD